MLQKLWDKRWFTFIRWLYLTLFAMGLLWGSIYMLVHFLVHFNLVLAIVAGVLGTLSCCLLWNLIILGIKLYRTGWANPDKNPDAFSPWYWLK